MADVISDVLPLDRGQIPDPPQWCSGSVPGAVWSRSSCDCSCAVLLLSIKLGVRRTSGASSDGDGEGPMAFTHTFFGIFPSLFALFIIVVCLGQQVSVLAKWRSVSRWLV